MPFSSLFPSFYLAGKFELVSWICSKSLQNRLAKFIFNYLLAKINSVLVENGWENTSATFGFIFFIRKRERESSIGKAESVTWEFNSIGSMSVTVREISYPFNQLSPSTHRHVGSALSFLSHLFCSALCSLLSSSTPPTRLATTP